MMFTTSGREWKYLATNFVSYRLLIVGIGEDGKVEYFDSSNVVFK